MSEQAPLPLVDGALILGPRFFYMELPGDPHHWERVRARIVYPKGKKPFIHFFTTKEMEAYKGALSQLARVVMKGRAPTDNPVAMSMTVFLRVPKSWTKRDREAALRGALLPTSKPDGDNYLKLIDALNGIVWGDDAQVVSSKVVKRYSADPGLCIEVREMLPP